MRFPVYPEWHRRFHGFILKIRYYLLTLFPIGIALFCLGFEEPHNLFLILSGTVLGLAGALFFATFHAHDAMIWVEIKPDGIHVSDANRDVFRTAEYCCVRNAEIRTMQVTRFAHNNYTSYRTVLPDRGVAVQLIMVYINGALCFDDLKLKRLKSKGPDLYWCDEIFNHHNCFAFVYDEAAWNLLNEQITVHSVGKGT